MAKVAPDPRGFVEVHILRDPPLSRLEAERLGREVLETSPGEGPIRLFVRFEKDVEQTIGSRMEWILFITKHRRRLRIALQRPGYVADGLTPWAQRIGLELRECRTDDEAVRFLLEA